MVKHTERTVEMHHKLICCICHEHGHVATRCTLTLREMLEVLVKFEALTPEEQASVHIHSYKRAKAYFPNRLPVQTPSTKVMNSSSDIASNPTVVYSLVAVPQMSTQVSGMKDNIPDQWTTAPGK